MKFRYKNQLFVDLTACAQFNRIGDPLTSILDRDDVHDNLGKRKILRKYHKNYNS